MSSPEVFRNQVMKKSVQVNAICCLHARFDLGQRYKPVLVSADVTAVNGITSGRTNHCFFPLNCSIASLSAPLNLRSSVGISFHRRHSINSRDSGSSTLYILGQRHKKRCLFTLIARSPPWSEKVERTALIYYLKFP